MSAVIITVLTGMFLGDTFNLAKYEKGNANVFDQNAINQPKVIDRSFTRSQYKLVETSTQAREFLDISGSVSLRIKKGDIDVQGTWSYLKNTANRQNFVELLVRVQHETITETIPSHIKPTEEWMSSPKEPDVTHYVRSLTYGGELIASLRLKANNREERQKIKAAVAANLQLTGTFDLNANGSFDKLKKDLAGMYNIDIEVLATKTPSKSPESAEELMELVENYPKDIAAINDGKGKVIKAELFPLTSLRTDYIEYMPNRAIMGLLNDVETKYDDIRTVVREFYPWESKRLVSTDEQDELVRQMYGNLTAAQTAFHLAISNLDESMNGKIDQFKEAFKSYGTGKNNIPNRFQRWFWKLRHEVTEEPIIWQKPEGSGTVYINWGQKTCNSSGGQKVELMYSGQAAGSLDKAWGGGKDYKCLPHSQPAISNPIPMQPKPATIDSVEFRTLIEPDKSGPIPCAACMLSDVRDLKTFYALTSCPKHWRKEYSGLTMADSGSTVDSDFLCLNKEVFSTLAMNEGGKSVSKLNPVWMNCENCNGDKVVPCIVCSYDNKLEI
ncbi:uncharacterized protein [Parasteatoda tepidariorum]|uniref:uncharacterized protein n=1 Tax=Parasteatoda tepidariorum TaxID=114398 RepID=UPI001C71C175|nr:uncharacterized protein LOC107436749 isoform X1 [Parasteatoda tepidariorum]XP_042907433.1 uncharacterized protein LOC107436749 isoform X2 [Parasteatoda tepidariorum]